MARDSRGKLDETNNCLLVRKTSWWVFLKKSAPPPSPLTPSRQWSQGDASRRWVNVFDNLHHVSETQCEGFIFFQVIISQTIGSSPVKLWKLHVTTPETEMSGLSSSPYWLRGESWAVCLVPGAQWFTLERVHMTWTAWCYNLANIVDATPCFCIANSDIDIIRISIIILSYIIF